jgi:hypothetical protein
MDGGGYPDGLRGPDIPLPVRVLAVADVYDSLSSKRPYRRAIPHDSCIELLRTNAASGGLDPVLVDRFCALPEVGNPAALEKLRQIENGVPLEPTPAASANGSEDDEGDTKLDAPSGGDNLSNSWFWQSIKKMRSKMEPAPSSAKHSRAQ